MTPTPVAFVAFGDVRRWMFLVMFREMLDVFGDVLRDVGCFW